jgi:hypothetical protein
MRIRRSGAGWHDLPERHGKWKSVRKRFGRRAKMLDAGAPSRCRAIRKQDVRVSFPLKTSRTPVFLKKMPVDARDWRVRGV